MLQQIQVSIRVHRRDTDADEGPTTFHRGDSALGLLGIQFDRKRDHLDAARPHDRWGLRDRHRDVGVHSP